MPEQARPATERPSARPPQAMSYWQAAREPLHCLVFLFPLVAVYEAGALLLRPEAWPGQRLVAQEFIRKLVAWFGPDAVWIPGAALIVTLVVWQQWSSRRWRVRAAVPVLMALESLVLTLPLFVLGRLLQQTAPGGAVLDGLRLQVVLALGAAVYEELVFRFYLIGGLERVFDRVCRAPRSVAVVAAAAIGAVAFAACHFRPVGSEAFTWPVFLMLTAAGGYLATVFVLRGLGVSTGCHAAYNVLCLLASG